MPLLGAAAVAMWWDIAPTHAVRVRGLAFARALSRADEHSRVPARIAMGERGWGRGLLRSVRAGSLRDPDLTRLSRAPERSHTLVHEDDAASPEYGAKSMSCSRQLRRRLGQLHADGALISGRGPSRQSASSLDRSCFRGCRRCPESRAAIFCERRPPMRRRQRSRRFAAGMPSQTGSSSCRATAARRLGS